MLFVKLRHLQKLLVNFGNVYFLKLIFQSSSNLDCYRDLNNPEIFSNAVVSNDETIFDNERLLFYLQDYYGQNLLEIVAKDFGDYARQVMRILYTNDELRSCILPPGRSHLTRKALDSDRFSRLNGLSKIFSNINLFFLQKLFEPNIDSHLICTTISLNTTLDQN